RQAQGEPRPISEIHCGKPEGLGRGAQESRSGCRQSSSSFPSVTKDQILRQLKVVPAPGTAERSSSRTGRTAAKRDLVHHGMPRSKTRTSHPKGTPGLDEADKECDRRTAAERCDDAEPYGHDVGRAFAAAR